MVDFKVMSENLDKALVKAVDVVKSVTTEPVMKVVNQRLSNPFFLCFISSWILCNWDRVLLLIFSFGVGIEQRIDKVKAIPSNSVFWGINVPHAHTFWYPFAASVIFVVGTPFLTCIVDLLQNGAINKKNSNDSLRKQNDINLKMKEIQKKVEFEHIEEQTRLQQQKKTKQIELDISSLEKKHTELETKIRDQNIMISSKQDDINRQEKAYDDVMKEISKLRQEVDSKNKELKGINGSIIEQQRKLDKINNDLSGMVLPGTLLTGLNNKGYTISDDGKLLTDNGIGLFGGLDPENVKKSMEVSGLGGLKYSKNKNEK